MYAVEFSHRSGERAARAPFLSLDCCSSTEVAQNSHAATAWLDVWHCALPTAKPHKAGKTMLWSLGRWLCPLVEHIGLLSNHAARDMRSSDNCLPLVAPSAADFHRQAPLSPETLVPLCLPARACRQLFAQSWRSPWSYWPSSTAQQAQLCSDVPLSYNSRHLAKNLFLKQLLLSLQVVTWSTWPSSGLMSSPSLRTPGIQPSTACWCPWWTSSLQMLHSPTRWAISESEPKFRAQHLCKGLTSARLCAFCQEPCGRLL